jgi:hypothetical protein
MNDGRSIESIRLAVKTGRTFEVLDDDAIRFPFSHTHIASRQLVNTTTLHNDRGVIFCSRQSAKIIHSL